MKITKFLAMMVAAVTMTMGFSSCGDDDDDAAGNASFAVEGTYSGDEVLTVMSEPFDRTTDYTFTKSSENTVDLVIPAIDAEGHMSLPELKIEGIVLTAGDKAVTGKLDSYEGTVVVDGNTKAYTMSDVTVIFSEESVSVVYTLKYGNMPFPFAGTFTGTKK